MCAHYPSVCNIGDAVLAFWRCSKKNRHQTVTHVMENALSIQENCDNFKVDEDINLRMKIAISIGDVFIYHLGMIPWLVFCQHFVFKKLLGTILDVSVILFVVC